MNNSWALIYVTGCVVEVIVLSVNSLILWTIRTITGANTVKRNLKKLEPPDRTSFLERVGKSLGAIIFEIALSWIGVVLGVWVFLRTLLGILQEVFASTPEEIRRLRYPLRNNPSLSRETVWAYLTAVAALGGNPVTDPTELLSSTEDIVKNYPDFNSGLALRQLQSLGVVDSGVAAAALDIVTQLQNSRVRRA